MLSTLTRVCVFAVVIGGIFVASEANAQTLTYRGYATSGTLYGCMTAPKTNQGDWGIQSRSAVWAKGGSSGSMAMVTSEYSTWNLRRWTWQAYGVPSSTLAGSTVTVTVVFKRNYAPYDTVTRVVSTTLPTNFPAGGTSSVLYCW